MIITITKKHLIFVALFLLLGIPSFLGGYTYYHFFIKDTGVQFKDGSHVNRATLVDMTLEVVVNQNKQE